MNRWALIAVMAAVCSGAALGAPTNTPAAPLKPLPDPRVAEERKLNQDWGALSIEEKKWIIRYCHAIREMPEQERRLINDRFDKFLRMTPEERTIMKQNYAKWQAMSPEDKQKAREEYVRHQKAYEAEWKKKHPTQPPPPLEFTVSSVQPEGWFYRDEFQLMILQLELQGDQLKTFQVKLAERLKALENWDKSRNGRQLNDLQKKIQAARQAREEPKIKQLEEAVSPLIQEHWKLRFAQRADVMSVLTLPQQQKWAAFVLFDKIRYRNLRGVTLTPAQLEQARAICTEFATKLVKEDTIANDPYLTAMEQLREDVANNIKANVLGLEPPRAEAATKPPEPSAVP